MASTTRYALALLLPCAVTLSCDEPQDDADSGSAVIDAGAGDAAATDASGGDPYCPVVGYAACGGDILGTWAFRSTCPDDPVAAAALCEHPYDDRAVCTGTGNEAVCNGTTSGTLTFNSDGTVDIDVTVSMLPSWGFTDACLADVAPAGASAEERCLGLGNDHLTCTYDGHCTCVSDPMDQSDLLTATYEIVDGDLTIGDDPPASYCVDGDLLTMDYYAYHPVSWRYWVLERE